MPKHLVPSKTIDDIWYSNPHYIARNNGRDAVRLTTEGRQGVCIEILGEDGAGGDRSKKLYFELNRTRRYWWCRAENWLSALRGERTDCASKKTIDATHGLSLLKNRASSRENDKFFIEVIWYAPGPPRRRQSSRLPLAAAAWAFLSCLGWSRICTMDLRCSGCGRNYEARWVAGHVSPDALPACPGGCGSGHGSAESVRPPWITSARVHVGCAVAPWRAELLDYVGSSAGGRMPGCAPSRAPGRGCFFDGGRAAPTVLSGGDDGDDSSASSQKN